MAVFYMNSVKPDGEDASVLSEDDKFSHNGIDPFMDIAKDGSFSDDTIEETLNLFTSLTLNENISLDESYDPAMIMSAIDAAGDWVMGGGMLSVGGEAVPANLAKVIMSVVPATAVGAAIKHMWPEIKSWMMSKNESAEGLGELSPSAYDAAAQAGEARGDARGKRIASTAKQLKSKTFQGKPFEYIDVHARTNPKGQITNVKEVRNNEGKVVQFKIEMHPSGGIIIADKGDGTVSVKTPVMGNDVTLTRGSAAIVATLVNDLMGLGIKPNDLKQH